jgi:hypothetical protein
MAKKTVLVSDLTGETIVKTTSRPYWARIPGGPSSR